ncbi:hypothetical protein TUMSATVNIG1_25170 [Vibrio nigripulchritudo]|uniref:hypothetical protein n=1 Tax=Vibrio nigripulchritudo TaxID=28173 RepID=UPI001909E6B4|nr:hypothetical protein [Vibrio nigripulchritudo]BCL70554.1 hypothetical protein VNTUMSATTG_24910 [Vibrio nigripulchritudo]BDU31908.1 hypothetical protein TUMSATVNIG1_25170 [Vibrio nigripulchritudo]
MRKLKPKDYIKEFYPGSGMCPKTVTNWIKKGKLRGEQTPTGRWLVLVEADNYSVTQELLNFLETE